jgi:hypothetical protein
MALNEEGPFWGKDKSVPMPTVAVLSELNRSAPVVQSPSLHL